MYEVSFHLRSGAVIKQVCEDLKVTTRNGEISGYEMTGIPKNAKLRTHYIRIDTIDCITTRKLGWPWPQEKKS